jgi:CelD/BcsL family acetyltransferase involved in cellulose biosynthesis
MRFGPSVSRYWCKAYLENYSQAEQVLFFEYCSADGRSHCLFPGRDVGNGEVRLLFNETADYQDVFSVSGPQEGLPKIISSIFSLGFRTITLDKLHGESPIVHTITALGEGNGIRVSRHKCDKLPIVRIQRKNDIRLWDDVQKSAVCAYWNKSRRLSHKAHVEFQIITDFVELASLLDRMFAMHIQRWERTTTKSKFSTPERRLFTRQICEEASKRRELFLPVLFVDGTLVSYRLAFRRGRVIYDWIPSYATEFRPHSVGAFSFCICL